MISKKKFASAASTIAAAALLSVGLALPSSAAAPATEPSAVSSGQKIGAPESAAAQSCSQPGGTRPTLRRGSTGPWVTYLQCLINTNVAYDFWIDQDGDFGYRTLAGVLWLQVCEENVLGSFGVNGEVGTNTWSKAISPDGYCRL